MTTYRASVVVDIAGHDVLPQHKDEALSLFLDALARDKTGFAVDTSKRQPEFIEIVHIVGSHATFVIEANVASVADRVVKNDEGKGNKG